MSNFYLPLGLLILAIVLIGGSTYVDRLIDRHVSSTLTGSSARQVSMALWAVVEMFIALALSGIGYVALVMAVGTFCLGLATPILTQPNWLILLGTGIGCITYVVNKKFFPSLVDIDLEATPETKPTPRKKMLFEITLLVFAGFYVSAMVMFLYGVYILK